MKKLIICTLAVLLSTMNVSYPLYAMEEEPTTEVEETNTEPTTDVEQEIVEEPSQEEVQEDVIVEEDDIVEEVQEEEQEVEEEIKEEAMDAALYDGILRYVFLDATGLENTQAQKIVVALTDEVESVNVIVSSDSHTYTLDCTNQAENLYEFEYTFTEPGEYQVQSIQYILNGEKNEYNATSMGISFEVNENVDAYVASIQSDSNEEATIEIENALTNANPELVKDTSLLSKVKDSLFTDCLAARDLVITLDPGHGASDGGATVYDGSHEKDLNLKIATYLKSYLEQYQGVKVYMTRYDDSICPDLDERARIAFQYQSDVMISVHLNATGYGNAYGAEVYYPNSHYLPQVGMEGKQLASDIEDQLAGLGIYRRGIRIRDIGDASSSYSYNDGSDGDYYGIIRHSKKLGMPGIIIEHCFVDNKNDFENYLSSEEKLQKLAMADCEGIVNAFNLSKKNEVDDALDGYTISFDGNVGVNFYMSLCQETIDDKNAYVLMSLPNSGTYTEKKVYVKDVHTKTINNKHYYVFPCEVSTKEMTKDIKVKLVTSKYEGEEHTFTVNGYADYIIEHSSEYEAKIVQIAKALKEYGSATQIYFDYNTENLPVSIDSIEASDFSSYAKNVMSEDEQIKFMGARLLLKSKIGIKLYFQGGDTFLVNGQSVQTTSENGYNVVTISDISYTDIYQMYTISSGNLQMEYGFLSYANDASKSNNEELMNICYSLYNFYLALTQKGKTTLPKENSEKVYYEAHMESIGWLDKVFDGTTSGYEDKNLRLEAFRMKLEKGAEYPGGIEYRSYVQNKGWEDSFKKDGQVSGTSGKGYRLEGVQIKLYGEVASHYNVYYRVYVKNFGWLDWAKNGQSAGSKGYDYKIEAMQVVLVEKGKAAPGETKTPYKDKNSTETEDTTNSGKVIYSTHVQNIGWQKEVKDGNVSGTSGQSLRLEAIRIRLGDDVNVSGGIEYKTHIQNIGWESEFKKDNEMSGTSGKSYRLEAIQIQLYGDVAKQYDVYYRVHAQEFGWMDWAKNGQSAGTQGYSYRLEAIEIVLVEKGKDAPGKTTTPFKKYGETTTTPTSDTVEEDGMYLIMGNGHATVEQMVKYYNTYRSEFDVFSDSKYNGIYAKGGAKTIKDFCQIYYEEAKAEGVNVEVAFTQAMLETGFLKFGGDVLPDQYNFAGMGATGGVPGNSFKDVRQGIRAQIQHLKCYGSTEPLNNENVDSRWWEGLRGKAKYVEYLAIPKNPYGTGWAGDATYGTKLRTMIADLTSK